MRLVVIEVPGLPPGMTQAQFFDLQSAPDRKVWVVGRQLGSDIHLVDSSVSRRHAEITVQPEGLIVRDLDSANGTYINERPLPANSPTLLRPGDRLRVGNVVTLLEAGPQKGIYAETSGWADAQVTQKFDRRQLPAERPAPTVLPSTPASYPSAASAPAPSPLHPSGQPSAEQEATRRSNAEQEATRRSRPEPTPARESGPAPVIPPAAFQPPAPVSPAPYQPAPVRPAAAQPYSPGQVPAGGAVPAQGVHYEQPAASIYQQPAPRFNLAAEPEQGRLPFAARAEAAPVEPKPRPVERKPRRIPWLIIVPLLLAVLVAGALIYFLTQSKPAAPAVPTVALPAATFSGPATNETALGLNLARPAAWQRSDQSGNSVLIFRPESQTSVVYLEKAPGRTITSDKLTPQQAVTQYVANVRAASPNAQITQEPAATTLKDGTPAALARLVFSTTQEPKVTDYNLTAISFKCQDALYFASAAAEGKDNTPAVRQDLDAALANITCAR